MARIRFNVTPVNASLVESSPAKDLTTQLEAVTAAITAVAEDTDVIASSTAPDLVTAAQSAVDAIGVSAGMVIDIDLEVVTKLEDVDRLVAEFKAFLRSRGVN